METILEIDPLTEFLAAMRNPVIRTKYQRRLLLFFQFLELEGTPSQQARLFAAHGKSDPVWATYQINEYMRKQKERAEREEIPFSTLPNYWKPIRFFCEENDITLNWKKITRRIPKGRKFANDRAPTREEIILILGYRDPRIKPVVLSMVSGGFRVGPGII